MWKKYFKINYKILSIILVVIIVILLLILYLLILDSDDKNSEKPMNEDLYNARHILVDDYETAELVIDLLDTGVDFCKLAKNYSKDSATSNNCGYVGSFEEGDMEFGFEEEVKSLNYNEYSSQPVQTEYGYHVIMRIK